MAEPYVLLIEDNDHDAELTALAFKRARVTNPIVRVSDGNEALDWLMCRGAHVDRDADDLPALILLDLDLPKMSGHDVLKTLRSTERLKHLPVVVLTSSGEEKDLLAAYERRANSYVRKPIDHDEFTEAARRLGLYWLVLNVNAPAHARSRNAG